MRSSLCERIRPVSDSAAHRRLALEAITSILDQVANSQLSTVSRLPAAFHPGGIWPIRMAMATLIWTNSIQDPTRSIARAYPAPLLVLRTKSDSAAHRRLALGTITSILDQAVSSQLSALSRLPVAFDPGGMWPIRMAMARPMLDKFNSGSTRSIARAYPARLLVLRTKVERGMWDE